jgi:hypothetical protein
MVFETDFKTDFEMDFKKIGLLGAKFSRCTD